MSDSGEVTDPVVHQAVEEAPPVPVEDVEVKDQPLKEEKPKKKKKMLKHDKIAAHPPYFQMIKDAILALNEKNGSSPYAIAKYIESEHKSVLPGNFRKILGLQLKNSTGKGKLIKVKASYKLSQAGKKEKAAATRSARANAVKPEQAITKKRRSSRSKSVNQMQKEASEKAKSAVGGRRMRKSAPATKAKQPKSIKSTVKKVKKTAAV